MPPSVTESIAVVAQLADTESPVCAMCAHPSEAHDGIATRYCAASASGALSRGCVCKLPPVS